MKSIKKAYTYDDVQIIPEYSNILSRKDISLCTRLTRNYEINIPLMSAPMDSITEKEMMLKMWDLGGIGFLHRFLSYEDRLNILKSFQDEVIKINNTNLYFPKPMLLGITIGVKDDDIPFIEKVLESCYKLDKIVLIDIAHGHHELMQKTLRKLRQLKEKYTFDIIAGNVATGDATSDLISWGADAVKVGIGGGSLCTTRINTGVGIPMITSIMECYEVAKKYNIPIIADGGMRKPGDCAKALAAGASSCMLGNIISGTKETPGEISREGVWPNETLYKKYRGSASVESKLIRGEANKNVEGVSTSVLYKGKVSRIITDICDGIQSSMSYVGVNNISDFQEASFVEITNAGIIEASPHGKKPI